MEPGTHPTILTRPPLVFPSSPIHTTDGLRHLLANFRALIKLLESASGPAVASSLDTAMAHLWYSLIRSQESKPRAGYYSTILPRLLRVQVPPSLQPRTPHAHPPKPQTIHCTGRLVLQLTNPDYTPAIRVCAFEAPEQPAAGAAAECMATLSVIDITQVRSIPPLPTTPTSTPSTLQMIGRSSSISPLSAYIQWAVSEFNTVFLQPPPPTTEQEQGQRQK